MKLRLLRSAIEDLAEGRSFYDLQQPGIGDYFFDSIFSDIEALASQAGIHSLHFKFHRLLASRFPYAIYYKILEGGVVVFRVLDCRRDPRKIAGDLKAVS
jgi:plasmid stabilization system protein ParE